MKWVILITIGTIAACAIAIGDRSTATVGTQAEVKREVAASAPVIEEILLEKK